MSGELVAAIVSLVLLTGSIVVGLRARQAARKLRVELDEAHEKNQEFRSRFSNIIDADAEVAKARADFAAVQQESQHFQLMDSLRRRDLDTGFETAKAEDAKRRRELEAGFETARADDARRRRELVAEYESAKAVYDRLRQEISLLEENLEDISFGLYKPHFDFSTSEEYKRRIETVREQQKVLIKDGRAATCAIEWSVGGSRKEGERMQKQYTKILLRAFNGECDAAVAKVAWNNVTRMEERIRKAHSAINDLGGVMKIAIAPVFLELKLAELRLEYELEDKKHQEQDEQRRIKEQMRDEEKAQREAERARQDAEADESRYEKALEKARLEVAKAKGEEHQRLTERVLQLQEQLEEARRKRERAVALAQLTKSGYVYVISNVGSFGDNVYKIGMTRRLDPMDRVKELGDASVPFCFDVHAMVYSEDAPALENAFHRQFAERSVNLINMRKEFFSVTLDELETFARRSNVKIDFTRIAEAREYRESLAIRRKSGTTPAVVSEPFPAHLPVAG